MSKPNKATAINKSEYEPLQFVRWLLFLITACGASGIQNVSRDRLHTLLFISFSSARFYGLKPLRQRAQRTEHGPYYRAAHIALGKLVLSGLVEVRDFKPHFSKKNLQFDGVFSLTVAGLKVANCLKQTDTGAHIYRFVLDLCLGVASSMKDDDECAPSLEDALLQDLAYQEALHRNSHDLVMEESAEVLNPTVAGLNSIDQFLRSQFLINNRDVLSAYQRLLVKRAS